MAEYRQELFKKNGLNHPNGPDNYHKQNRKQQRTNLFDSQRNGVGNGEVFITSTPYHKNKIPGANVTDDDKENSGDDKNQNEEIRKTTKQLRKEAYLQRFIKWKKEKQNRMEELKKTKKAPFIPAGKVKKVPLSESNGIQQKSFAPPEHKFKAPLKIADLQLEKVNQSIYLAIDTPPKHKMQEGKVKKLINRPAQDWISTKSAVSTSTASVPSRKARITTNKSAKSDNEPKQIPTSNSLVNGVNKAKKPESCNKGAIPKKLTAPPQERVAAKKVITAAVSATKVDKKTVSTTSLSGSTSNERADSKPLAKLNSSCSNAVAKAKALNSKNRTQPKKVERAKLTVNLKAKHKMSTLPAKVYKLNNHLTTKNGAANLITPLELCNPTNKFNFFTSTETKSQTSASNKSRKEDFSKLCQTVSPIITFSPKQKSTKRALLKAASPLKAEKPMRKHNFLVKQNLDTTTLETGPRQCQLKELLATPELAKSSPRSAVKLTLNEATDFEEALFKSNKPMKINEISEATLTQEQVNQNLPFTCQKDNMQLPESVIDPKFEEDLTLTTSDRAPNYLSSYVSCSRGKVSARKEHEKRDSIYLTNTPLKTTGKNEQQGQNETSIEIRRSREAVLYFRKQLNGEIARLHELCEKWQTYKDGNSFQLQQCGGDDMIDVAIGQTKLLTSKKFMQFNGLIDRCESHANGTAAYDDGSEATKIITPVDLEGFWSMLGLQVENIEKRFDNLNRWKANDWQDPELQTQKPVKRAAVRSKKAAPVKLKPRANTALKQKMREMRAAMLTAKQDQETEKTDHSTQKTNQLQHAADQMVKHCSPRRLRRSTLTKTEMSMRRESLVTRGTPERIRLVVPDRRSCSVTPTIISVPVTTHRNSLSPLSPANRNGIKNTDDRTQLFKQALCTRRSQSLSVANSSPPRTPSPVNRYVNDYKPILKTPGTASAKPRNVSFNKLCSVKKFYKFGKYLEATEYDKEEQVHIDELKLKIANEAMAKSPNVSEVENTPTYRLRNRKVKLRPSSEIEIP